MEKHRNNMSPEDADAINLDLHPGLFISDNVVSHPFEISHVDLKSYNSLHHKISLASDLRSCGSYPAWLHRHPSGLRTARVVHIPAAVAAEVHSPAAEADAAAGGRIAVALLLGHQTAAEPYPVRGSRHPKQPGDRHRLDPSQPQLQLLLAQSSA